MKNSQLQGIYFFQVPPASFRIQ